METTGLSKYTNSFGVSLALCSVINALLVVAKEKSERVMAGMKQLTGHHWITHSAFTVLLFVGLGFLLAKVNGHRGLELTASRLLATLLAGITMGGGLILGFYLIGD